jgi:hypothetical protein
MRPGQLPERRPTAGIRHRGQAEVDPVCENGGQQRFIVLGRSPAPLMGEATGEPGPAIDIEQHVRDLGARHQMVDGIPKAPGLRRHRGPQRRDFQLAAGEIDILELSCRGECCHLRDLFGQNRPLVLQIPLGIGFNCERERAFRSQDPKA